MPDAPRCMSCYMKGFKSQTYKVAGKALFHCHGCGSFYQSGSFEPIEFGWRENKEAWQSWIESKQNPVVLKKPESLSGKIES